MATEADSIGRWRELLGSQVFEPGLDTAIIIAALDDPTELRRRRDHIMELLYALPAASPAAGIAKSVSAAPIRAEEEDAEIAKNRVVIGKKHGGEPAPTSQAPVRAETSARSSSAAVSTAVAEDHKADLAPPRTVEAAASGPNLEAKLAASKRKVREGYEEVAEAKRQRRIQVIEAPVQRRKPVVRVSRKVCAPSMARCWRRRRHLGFVATS